MHWRFTTVAAAGCRLGMLDHRRILAAIEDHASPAALDLIVEAIGKAGFTPGQDVALAIDAAASEFYAKGTCHFEGTLIGSRVPCAATHRGVIT